MNMQVMHFLSAFCTRICNDTKTTLWIRPTTLRHGQLRRKTHHAPHQCHMLWAHMRHRQDVYLGND